MAVKSILMICRGNICRSPMAERFFANQLNQAHSSITVNSTGINALIDYPADPAALHIMHQHGIDISKHRGQQLTENLIRTMDLILVMTQSQLDILSNQFRTAKGKTFLLGYWDKFELQDPYTQPYEAFEKVCQQIELSWQSWKTRILECQICV